MKYVKMQKSPNKTQLVEADRVDFYRQYGWEPVITQVTAHARAPKKTVKPEPAVEEGSSEQEVGTDDTKGD